MKQALLVILILLVTACAPTLKVEQHAGDLQLKDQDLPRRVAILPFANGTDEAGLETVVRRNFANHFSSKNYLDLKLPVVDEKLVLFEKSSGKKVEQATPQELSAALAADGLLYGKVTGYNKIYAGVYSQLAVEAEVWLLNAATGKELFRFKESVRYHEGGLPLSPLSAAVTVVSTAMNLREIQKVRMVNELCYKFMEKIPAPKTLASGARPVIREILTNAAEGPFGSKRVIKAGLEGEPGLVGTFDIGNFRKGLPMTEAKPGIYTGEYAVLPGDDTRDMPITVTLSRPGGYETSWVDPGGFVTIDTTAPPPVAGLRGRGYPDRIELSWEPVKNVPDLRGYRVLRSESPLSGYAEVAVIETPFFRDDSASPGKSYYYKVASQDRVGNEAESAESVRVALVAVEPLQVAGELKGDTVWDGAYLVTASVTVPRGVTLTVSDNTRILFTPDAGLQVLGRLAVRGVDAPVEFAPSGAGKWSGIALDGAGATMSRFTIRGADTGISSRESEMALDGGLISGCDTGVAVSGMRRVEVKALTISGNLTGLRLSQTSARVTGSSFIANKEAIASEAFSGEIRDNNFIDNEKNISADKPLAVGANWFGTVQADGLRLANASASHVYDGRVPGGSVVPAVLDPYLKMTAEERRQRGTELLVEAGNYFRQRNYGKALDLFAEQLKAAPCAETYYYLSLCHQEMKERDKALKVLREGVATFPHEPLLWKSLGMLLYEEGEESEAGNALKEALRLSPEDRQAGFVLERLKVNGSAVGSPM
jgi:hypothetical protein